MKNNKLLTFLIISIMASNAGVALSSESNKSLEERVKYLENKYEINDNFPNFSDIARQFDDMAKLFQQQMDVLNKNFEKYNSTLRVNRLSNRIEIMGNFPDFSKDEILIKTTDDFIVISANKKMIDEKDNKYYASKYNSFYQSVRLPFNAEIDKIKTEYRNKKLKIIIPLDVKKEKFKEIKIQ